MGILLTRMCGFVLAATKNLPKIGKCLFLISILQYNFSIFVQNSLAATVALPTPTATPIESARAMFRVENEFFFDRDVLSLIHQVNAFACAFPETQLIKVIQWEPKKMESVMDIVVRGGPDQQEQMDEFRPLILAVKLRLSVKGQAVIVLPETKSLFMQSLKKNHCSTGNMVTENALMQWLELEVFLRARFSGLAQPHEGDKEWESKRQALLASMQVQYQHQVFFPVKGYGNP